MVALNSKSLKNIPNIITIIRIILVIPIIVIFVVDNFSVAFSFSIENQIIQIYWNQIIVAILFIVASVSDFLDGYLSRKFNWQSNFGKFWDPLADKILINTTLILLCVKNFTFVVFTILFILRDVIVDGIRMYSASKKIIVSANIYGKLKTVFQMFAIIVLLFIGSNTTNIIWWYWGVTNLLVYISLFTSYLSMLVYTLDFMRNKNFINY